MLSMSLAEIGYQPALPIPPNVALPISPGLESASPVSAERRMVPQHMPTLGHVGDLVLKIEIPAFGTKLLSSISNIQAKPDCREVVFESVVDTSVQAHLTLLSEFSNGTSSELQIRNASLRFQAIDHKARTHFITDTLYAMLGLGGAVKLEIPNLNINLGLNFSISNREISNFLQLRQIQFGLLVIGRACGLEFDIPPHLSGDDINSIALAYHAIVSRQFDWRVNEITQPTPATEEMLTWLDNLKPIDQGGAVYKLMFGPSSSTRVVLGESVSLGQETILLDDAVIENLEVVRSELKKNDGHIVPIRIRPRSRKGRYIFANPPQLIERPWDKALQGFIALDEALDQALAMRYHWLASSTLSNLTDVEKTMVTTRPELSEDAHLLRD